MSPLCRRMIEDIQNKNALAHELCNAELAVRSNMNRGQPPQPFDAISGLFERRGIAEGRCGDRFLAVVKHVDVVGKAGADAGERTGTGDVAFRVAVRGEQPQQARFQVRQRYGALARCVPPGGGRRGCPRRGGFR